MNLEFVEFYPNPNITFPITKRRNVKNIGTIHIYLIDYDIDLRGISINYEEGKIFFQFPHFRTIDEDTKKPVSYPHFRFMNQQKHKELFDFLKNEVKPIVLKRIKGKKN